ncbi:hypothetical protein [Lysobacter enzymogenes]|uniref:Transmembrane protein n=1 Tax=Lysobacter enzymogenes TaxID=69 RepID=A0A3N2RH46_LYSEN|nr:hypothetical protein [Lysobacter enzymogenes]ROU06810.1 hypothetical protein D9T17_11895 [Lysobacter enzymogenes]
MSKTRAGAGTATLAALATLAVVAAAASVLLMYSCGLHPQLSPPQTQFWRFHPASLRQFCGPADTGRYLLAGGWRHPMPLAFVLLAAIAAARAVRAGFRGRG